MTPFERVYKQMFGADLAETLLWLLLSLPPGASYEDDCVHRSMCVVWCDPLDVLLCDVCGEVLVPEFGRCSDWERELTRPFRDAWS